MPRRRSEPNEISWNSAVSSCEKAGKWQFLGDQLPLYYDSVYANIEA